MVPRSGGKFGAVNWRRYGAGRQEVGLVYRLRIGSLLSVTQVVQVVQDPSHNGSARSWFGVEMVGQRNQRVVE